MQISAGFSLAPLRWIRRAVLTAWIASLLAAAVLASPATPDNSPQPEQPVLVVSRIKRVPVQSSALVTVGYSKRLHALEIEFRNGATYRYFDVPAAVHRAMMAAESKTRYYNAHIRGKYRSVGVRPRRNR